ncbi:hypothetical protein A0256_13890 [Mucilaginibacter sp. PAMC 26640]|nr:hypothetical protein A0256_13890 [Mucilaginibacter sp. PAMC 26640]
MTDDELIAYFQKAQLPETLRLDRATTQHRVPQAVSDNIELMKADKDNERCRYRLTRIINGLENPYDGPEVPRF